MNFEFSDEQQFIRDQARNFLSQQCTTAAVREILDSDASYHRKLWRQLIDLGWTGMAIPTAYGGLGLGYLELCVIAEELGRAIAPVPFSSSVYLASEALLMAGSEAQKQHYLPRLAAGEIIATLASGEGTGLSPVNCQFADSGLTGARLPVPDGDIADLFVVLARDERGSNSLYLVEAGASGIAIDSLSSIDPSRSQAKLSFSNTTAELLGTSGAGDQMLSKLWDKAAVLFAFEQIGGCQAAMEMGIAYTTERYAFGRQVASFQAIKHKFADMFTATELARSNAYYGAWALATDAAELALAAATTRVSASDAYYQVSKENIQAHGGMGFTWEFDCHLHYRRAQLLSSVIGSQPFWRNALVTRLLQQQAA